MIWLKWFEKSLLRILHLGLLRRVKLFRYLQNIPRNLLILRINNLFAKFSDIKVQIFVNIDDFAKLNTREKIWSFAEINTYI